MATEAVTEAELAVLTLIWERGRPTGRDLAGALYDKVTDSKLATVQKLVERLEAKGCVVRERGDRPHRFRALVGREEFLRDRLRGLADRLCDGAMAPLVTTLLRSKADFTPEQGDELRRLVDELWPTGGDQKPSTS